MGIAEALPGQEEETHPAMKAIARQQRAPGIVEGLPKHHASDVGREWPLRVRGVGMLELGTLPEQTTWRLRRLRRNRAPQQKHVVKLKEFQVQLPLFETSWGQFKVSQLGVMFIGST